MSYEILEKVRIHVFSLVSLKYSVHTHPKEMRVGFFGTELN